MQINRYMRLVRAATVSGASLFSWKRANASEYSAKRWDDFKHEFCDMQMLGVGGFGEVFHTTRFGVPLVMKVISKDSNWDFLNEIEAMKALRHPAIVNVYETFENKSFLFICMEFIQGETLYKRIVRDFKENEFTENDISKIMIQVLDAIRYMHSKNYIHGDLKPENIVFTSCDSNVLKLIDFGCTQRLKDFEFSTEIMGTIAYMAPEFSTGKYTNAVDLWALGIITFELLYGYSPFRTGEGKYDDRLACEMILKGFDPIEKDGMGPWFQKGVLISDDAKDFISRLLEPDPKRRMTAEEAMLHPWLQNDHQEVISKEIVKSLRAFSKVKRAQRAIAKIPSDKFLDDFLVKHIGDIFKAADTNQDGKLNKEELIAYFSKHGLNESDMKDIFNVLDENQDGEIYAEEFCTWLSWKFLMGKDERLYEIANRIDKDQNGKISMAELCEELGEEYAPVFQCLFKNADEIEIASFLKFLKRM